MKAGYSRTAIWRALAPLWLVLALAACQHRVVAPASPDDPVTVYIVDYGHHAGLALPSGDDRLTEWFWGDWTYFARGRRSLGDGLQALFGSSGSTLGRLELTRGDAAEIRAATGAEAVLPIVVDRRPAAALQAALSQRYARRVGSEIVQANGRRFVRDDAGYSLAYNSTHIVRDWLEALGCDVRGTALSARFIVSPPAAQAVP